MGLYIGGSSSANKIPNSADAKLYFGSTPANNASVSSIYFINFDDGEGAYTEWAKNFGFSFGISGTVPAGAYFSVKKTATNFYGGTIQTFLTNSSSVYYGDVLSITIRIPKGYKITGSYSSKATSTTSVTYTATFTMPSNHVSKYITYSQL